MIEFALNYSESAARLLRDGAIDVDRFKCPDWTDTISAARRTNRPVYVHFPIEVGTPKFATIDFAAIEKLATATGTPFINCHPIPSAAEFSDEARAEARLIEDVSALVACFGNDRVIVEMAPWGNPAENFVRGATEPEMIHRIVESTGCGLLLDLSHARITARVTGQDERDFLERMPVAHLRELHVTGLGFIGPILKDHLPMTSSDWQNFEWAMKRISDGAWATPWCVALEYGGVGELLKTLTDENVLLRDVPRMFELIRSQRR